VLRPSGFDGFGIAALVGLVIGIIWVMAGVLNFHGPR
jgi:hypothetical protein